MRLRRFDGIEVDFTFDDPRVRVVDKVTKQALESGKCAICQRCWLETLRDARVRCIYGGPFLGYVNVE
jgi:hypothetical protein